MNKQPELFDIVETPLREPANVTGQPEDWLIEPFGDWIYRGRLDPQKSIHAFLEQPKDLWLEPDEKRDRVTPEWIAAQKLPSLYLIQPEQVRIYIHAADYGNGLKRGRRASFCYRGVFYDWGMTDPMASARHFPHYDTCEPGYQHGRSLDCSALCVSLAPAWKGDLASQAYHYKLVAGIIEK